MGDYAVYEGALVPVDELMHHGIKGMKWGVRRYQNPDGSLTEAGRKRYYGYGTLDAEGMAKYSEHKKLNGEIVRQSTGKAALTGAALGAAVGGFAAGPAGAFLASAATVSLASMIASAAGTAAINTGAAWINNKKYKKALIKLADEKRRIRENSDNARKKDNEFYKKVIDSEEKRLSRKLTDKEKADEIKSYSKEGRGEEAAKNYLEQEKSNTKSNTETNKEKYMQTRNSFSTDERKDQWEEAMSSANDPKLTDKRREYEKARANRIKATDERNKNYKSPNRDGYDITFLEAIQNKEILEFDDTKAIDAEYAKYKKDPEKYFKEEADKLRDSYA